MNDSLQKAAAEWIRKRGTRPRVEETYDGYWAAPHDDQCPKCQYAKWSCNTGAHLKSEQHVAAKYDVGILALRRAVEELRIARGSTTTVYKALDVNSEGVLVSPNNLKDDGSSDWLPHAVTFASCSNAHDVPDGDCGCGLYAYWDIEDAETHGGQIVARLRIGGKIIECEHGVRAEAATITGIYAFHNPDLAAEVAERYRTELFTGPIDYEILEPGKEDLDEE
jgi:hypothetical protein